MYIHSFEALTIEVSDTSVTMSNRRLRTLIALLTIITFVIVVIIIYTSLNNPGTGFWEDFASAFRREWRIMGLFLFPLIGVAYFLLTDRMDITIDVSGLQVSVPGKEATEYSWDQIKEVAKIDDDGLEFRDAQNEVLYTVYPGEFVFTNDKQKILGHRRQILEICEKYL